MRVSPRTVSRIRIPPMTVRCAASSAAPPRLNTGCICAEQIQLLLEKGFQRVLGALLGLEARGVERARVRLEVVAEVRGALVADVGRVLLRAAFRQARREPRAHTADVQLGAAARALVAPRERQRQRGQRLTAAITKQWFRHLEVGRFWYFA